jgi:hypothetical protein
MSLSLVSVIARAERGTRISRRVRWGVDAFAGCVRKF